MSKAKSITIRDVPVGVHRELASRAARRGQSLQEFLRAELLRVASRPSQAELLNEIGVRKDASRTRLPASRIIAHRDADRA